MESRAHGLHRHRKPARVDGSPRGKFLLPRHSAARMALAPDINLFHRTRYERRGPSRGGAFLWICLRVLRIALDAGSKSKVFRVPRRHDSGRTRNCVKRFPGCPMDWQLFTVRDFDFWRES